MVSIIVKQSNHDNDGYAVNCPSLDSLHIRKEALFGMVMLPVDAELKVVMQNKATMILYAACCIS